MRAQANADRERSGDIASADFARYRSSGDPAALTAVFDRVAPELLALARHLAADSASAEDLVQECFLVAIRKAQRWDPRRPVTPWLVGILVREARRDRRRLARGLDAARTLQGAAAVSGAASGSEAERAAVHADMRVAVESALVDLPERYRDIVRSSALDGQAPAEIAARLGRAPGTVRVQLHRGLDLLRRALPIGFGVGAGVGAAPRGLAAVRASVASAARDPLAAPSFSLFKLFSFATIAMGTKTLLFAVLALVLIAGMYLKRGTVRSTPDAGGRMERAPGIDGTLAARGAEMSKPEPASRTSIDVQPLEAEAGEAQAPEPSAEAAWCRVVGRIVPVHGEVLNEPWFGFLDDGKSLARLTMPLTMPLAVAEVKADGTFAIRLERGSIGTLLFAEAVGRVGQRPWTVPDQDTAELGDLMLERGAEISGTARSAGELAPMGSLVLAQAVFSPTDPVLSLTRLQRSGDRIVRGSAMALVEAGGRFRLRGLEPTVTYQLVAIPKAPSAGSRAMLIAPKAGVRSVAPASGVAVEGQLMEISLRIKCSGSPVPDAEVVQLPPKERIASGGGLMRALMTSGPGFGRSDASGQIDVRLFAGPPVRVEVTAPGFKTHILELNPSVLSDGEAVPVELVPDEQVASFEVTLTGAGEAGLDGFRGMIVGQDVGLRQVRLGPVPLDGLRALFSAVPCKMRTGRFVLLAPELTTLQALPFVRGKIFYLNLKGLTPGEVRRQQVPVEQGGRAVVTLTGRNAKRPPSFELVEANGNIVRPPVYVRGESGFVQSPVLHTDGPIYLGMSLPPGRYTLRQSGPHYLEGAREVVVTAMASTEVAFHLEPRER